MIAALGELVSRTPFPVDAWNEEVQEEEEGPRGAEEGAGHAAPQEVSTTGIVYGNIFNVHHLFAILGAGFVLRQNHVEAEKGNPTLTTTQHGILNKIWFSRGSARVTHHYSGFKDLEFGVRWTSYLTHCIN